MSKVDKAAPSDLDGCVFYYSYFIGYKISKQTVIKRALELLRQHQLALASGGTFEGIAPDLCELAKHMSPAERKFGSAALIKHGNSLKASKARKTRSKK